MLKFEGLSLIFWNKITEILTNESIDVLSISCVPYNYKDRFAFDPKKYGPPVCFNKCTDSVLYNDYELMNGYRYTKKKYLPRFAKIVMEYKIDF